MCKRDVLKRNANKSLGLVVSERTPYCEIMLDIINWYEYLSFNIYTICWIKKGSDNVECVRKFVSDKVASVISSMMNAKKISYFESPGNLHEAILLPYFCI